MAARPDTRRDRSPAPSRAPARPRRVPTGWGAAVLLGWRAIVVAALSLAPFLTAAFRIDDPVFLWAAERIFVAPFDPGGLPIVWTMPVVDRLSKMMAGSPAAAYVFFPAALAGGAEWVAHAEQIVFVAIAIVATIALGRRLGLPRRPVAHAGLLLAACPTVLGMAGTAMPDVAAMASGTAALERLLAWQQTGRIGAAVASALLLAITMHARLHAAALLAVGLLLLLADPRRGRTDGRGRIAVSAAPLLGAVLLYVAIGRLFSDPSAPAATESLATAIGWVTGASRAASLSSLGSNFIAFALHWWACVPLVPLALVLCLRRRDLAAGAVALVAAGLVTAALGRYLPPPASGQRGWAVPLAAIALAVVATVTWRTLRAGGPVRRVLVLWLLAPLPIVVYVHFPSKYLLLAAPAFALFVASALRDAPPRLARALVYATVVLGVVLGLAILRADARFAELGREAAREWIAPRTRAGQHVWFTCHWGLQWYAERAGARPYTVAPPRPATGDWIVTCATADGAAPRPPVPGRLVAVRSTPAPAGCSTGQGAGFYSNGWGLVPWIWSARPCETLSLWEVTAATASR